MEFYKYRSIWTAAKKAAIFEGKVVDKSTVYQAARDMFEKRNDKINFRRTMLEEGWERLKQPYYNIWPAIVPMLLKLNLNTPTAHLDGLSVQPIEIRLPTKLEMPELCSVRSIIMGYGSVGKAGVVPCKGLRVTYDTRSVPGGYLEIPLVLNKTVEDLCKYYDNGIGEATAVIRLCTCIALINNNPDIIAPDILVSDKDKWIAASEDERLRLIEKAKERGKNGWNVGAGIEHIPHYRRPHPALVRIGKGRTLTRIVMRKGSVVHRGKITEVPSGYESSSN